MTAPTPAEVTKYSADFVVYRSHEIWMRILDRDDLGYDEDFFQGGGDLRAAYRMLAEVDRTLGSHVTEFADRFLDEPTLAKLRELIGEPALPSPSPGRSNEIQIFPVRKVGCKQQLFCFPSSGEGLYFRRLAAHLNGKMDLSIIRPANTFYGRELFCLEHEGQEAVEAIRKVQHEGPYFVAGYCYAGAVAFETARQLSIEGHDARVILFDVPMPGSPSLLRDWRVWIKAATRQWRRFWTSDRPESKKSLRRFSCRVLWSVLVPFRRLLVPIENVAAVRRMIQWAQMGTYPLYVVHPLNAPFLHILSTNQPGEDEAREFDPIARFGWRSIARSGIEERFVAHNHYNILHESNLPVVTETLLKWCCASKPIRELDAQAIGKL